MMPRRGRVLRMPRVLWRIYRRGPLGAMVLLESKISGVFASEGVFVSVSGTILGSLGSLLGGVCGAIVAEQFVIGRIGWSPRESV